MVVLEKDRLYGNLKKYTFFSPEVTFLGYIVTAKGVKVDESKVEAIRSWTVPKISMMCGVFMDLPHSTGGSLETSVQSWLQ